MQKAEIKMIEINSLTKKFGSLTAVDGVSLSIADNECFALLGLNGAGKSTLINMLTTQIKPTSGDAQINGLNLVKDKNKIRKIINISPQESAVAKNLTVRENLDLIASLYEVEEKDKIISSIIDSFGLREKENVLCKKLSGGQLRRLSIALAIITSPKILFLDEPTLGLDVKARKLLWSIVENLKKSMTIVLTTHYLEEVEFLADKIAIISKGKIKAYGLPQDIIAQNGKQTLEQAFLDLTEEEQ